MARRARRGLSPKARLSVQQFREELHPRGPGGEFRDKPGAGDDAPRRRQESSRVAAIRTAEGRAVKRPVSEEELLRNRSEFWRERVWGTFDERGRQGLLENEADQRFYRDVYDEALNTSLTTEEIAGFRGYCGATSRFQDVNDFLRGKRRGDDEVRAIAAGLDAATEKFTLKQDFVLYRGIRGAEKVFDGLQPGAVVSDPGFMSTTLKQSAAGSWAQGGPVMRIAAPEGTRIAVPGPNVEVSELEFIFPRSQRLRFVERRENEYWFEVID